MAEFFKVPITVVKQQSYVIGKEATKLLLENINDKNKQPQKIMIPCSITERQSCRKVF